MVISKGSAPVLIDFRPLYFVSEMGIRFWTDGHVRMQSLLSS
jgi:hypothetical protein